MVCNLSNVNLLNLDVLSNNFCAKSIWALLLGHSNLYLQPVY
jgi:hypothetical protein